MKKLIVLSLVFFQVANGHANVDIKMSINEVFVVPMGYDSNDNIEMTFLSELPGPCYEPAGHKLSLVENGNYEINFYAKLKEISSCQNSPALVSTPVHYSQTISLGELKAGDYSVQYQKQDQLKVVAFSVSEAQNDEIDDMNYAPVSNVFIPELIYFSDDVNVVLTGIIRSSCMSLYSHNIEVSRLGNIFVIIPKTQNIAQEDCFAIEVPLQNIISLGAIKKAGSYLIHVRSQSGLSVNKIFHVKEKDLDIGGVK